jgi:N-carbamoylputrescine amidase
MEAITVAAVSTRNWVGKPKRSLKNMAKWARKAVEQKAELIVFPELCVSGYVHHAVAWDLAETIPGPSTEELIAVARDLGVIICYGILERDADIAYNTQVLVNGRGIIGKQRKIHMPGHEYLYWRGGFELETFDIGKARVGIAICYDALFTELARSLYFKGAEILLMPFAYWSPGARRRFPEEDIGGLCYRTTCFANGCYGVLCNNAGKRDKSEWEPDGIKFPGWAGVLGPEGEVVAFTREKGHGEGMVVAELDPEKLAERRRSIWFIPRCLRPEVYVDMRDGDQMGKA